MNCEMRLSRSTMKSRTTWHEVERFKMRTKHRSFQLEENYLGVFILQGWFGGLVTGFVYLVIIIAHWDRSELYDIVVVWLWLSILATNLGVVKSTIMWGAYRLTKIQTRAVTRVVLTSLCTGLFAFASGFYLGGARKNDLIEWVSTLVAGGLPTAILVGSSIKPWELFTFGSIATRVGRSGSRNVLATLATLPLRFISLAGMAFWIGYVVYERRQNNWSSNTLLLSLIPLAYLFFSAYLTFRSPQKIVLLVIALLANIPLGIIVFSRYVNNPAAYWLSDAPPYTGAICMAFLTAWMVCLTGRLSVPIDRVALPVGHHCLGSRFIEWQEHHA